MNFRVCVAWVLFVMGIGGHLFHRTTDAESTYTIVVACFFMLAAIWERKS